jgi:hypothetical protein
MRKLASALVALGASWLVPDAHAQGKDAAAEPPGLDFLEYLGSWQAADDEWYEIAQWEKDNPDRVDAKAKPGADKAGKGRTQAEAEGDKGKGGGDQDKPKPDAPQTEERQ